MISLEPAIYHSPPHSRYVPIIGIAILIWMLCTSPQGKGEGETRNKKSVFNRSHPYLSVFLFVVPFFIFFGLFFGAGHRVFSWKEGAKTFAKDLKSTNEYFFVFPCFLVPCSIPTRTNA